MYRFDRASEIAFTDDDLATANTAGQPGVLLAGARADRPYLPRFEGIVTDAASAAAASSVRCSSCRYSVQRAHPGPEIFG